jgi:hypothetical protein
MLVDIAFEMFPQLDTAPIGHLFVSVGLRYTIGDRNLDRLFFIEAEEGGEVHFVALHPNLQLAQDVGGSDVIGFEQQILAVLVKGDTGLRQVQDDWKVKCQCAY